ncbi:MAG: hypothetical protein ACK5L3_03395, partial [Oscillospiraceae bacterium]
EAFVCKELYQSGLIISQAAEAILRRSGADGACLTLAPPDLWNRRQETGKSAADIFAENGVVLTKTTNARVSGWMAVKEWLKPTPAEDGRPRARLRIFANCVNLIRTLPAMLADPNNPRDAATAPHELTHAPDALRGFCVYWTTPAEAPAAGQKHWTRDMYEDYQNAKESQRALLASLWGPPPAAGWPGE